MPGRDPAHWLHRLDAGEWLAAAETELGRAEEALARRGVRTGVTHARRAAGMACNAVLVGAEPALCQRWGRSYMEHVVALSAEAAVPDDVRAAAVILRDTRAAPPALVPLRPDLAPVDAARRIASWCRDRIDRIASG